jgi:TRAP-type C4-dicarboxylate transport system substrate-binding protein
MGGKAITISPRLWGKQDVLNNGADAVETTYLRFHGKHVLKTQHSMFMTTILISNKFWETLTEQQQVAFRTAALVASRMEREWSVADGEKFEQDAVENGITIVDISEEDRLKLKKKSQLTYFKCKGLFTPGLVANMRTRH